MYSSEEVLIKIAAIEELAPYEDYWEPRCYYNPECDIIYIKQNEFDLSKAGVVEKLETQALEEMTLYPADLDKMFKNENSIYLGLL